MKKKGENSYKMSKYNELVDINGKHFLINLLTGNIVELDDEFFPKIREAINFDVDLKNLFSNEDLEFLLRRGFIVESKIEELDILKIWWKKGFSQNVLSLTLEPTLRCNFACTYCFEDTVNGGTMGNKEVNKLLKFIKNYMKRERINTLEISWFGGEPLLVKNVIDEITQGVREIFKELKIDFEEGYSASLVTKGSLLDSSVLEKLKIWKIKMVQITIDGSEMVHNLRRPFRGGKPSFNVVFKNFINLLKFIEGESLSIKVNLRCNFSLDVRDKVIEVFDMIPERYRKNINVYCKHYFPKSSEWRGMKLVSSLVHEQSISEVEAGLSMEVFRKGYKSERMKIGGAYFYCPASTMHHFELTPDLKVYKCNVAVGARPPVGEITDEGNIKYNVEELKKWILIDPFEDETCKSCKLLPICMGGCPLARVNRRRGCLIGLDNLNKILTLELTKIILKGGGS